MRNLVLGGTRFVGLHVVEAALAAGHLSGLDGDWDAVVDVSAYRPRHVGAARGAASEAGAAGGSYP